MAVILHIFGSIRGTNLRNNIARCDFPHDTGQLWYSLCPSYKEAKREGACESFEFKTTLANEVRFLCLKGKKRRKEMGGRVEKRRKKKGDRDNHIKVAGSVEH